MKIVRKKGWEGIKKDIECQVHSFNQLIFTKYLILPRIYAKDQVYNGKQTNDVTALVNPSVLPGRKRKEESTSQVNT